MDVLRLRQWMLEGDGTYWVHRFLDKWRIESELEEAKAEEEAKEATRPKIKPPPNDGGASWSGGETEPYGDFDD